MIENQTLRVFFPRLLTFALAFFAACPQAVFSQKSSEPKVVTGTVLLNEKSLFDTKALVADLKTDWKIKLDSVTMGDKTLVFSVAGATVMVAFLDYPAARDDIGVAARLSWLWKTAGEEAPRHQAQAVISVIGSANRTLELYKLFTKVAASLLENSRSSGVYMGGQYLLLSKGFYVAAARNMLDNQSLPIYCWVYFGMPGKGGGYTFGLQEFGLTEMEISDPAQSDAAAHATLYDAVVSVVKYGTRLTDGQSLTTEEGQKIPVRLTKAMFIEGQQVLRLDF
jgi:hypothetical protein